MILGLFGFALATAYVPGIHGAGSSPRWAVLVIGAAAALVVEERNRITWPHIFGALFVLWSLLTIAWSPAPEAFDSAWKLCLMALLFIIGAGVADLRPVFIGAALGVGVSSALVMLDVAGLISYQQVSPPSGLFVNGLYLAEFTAMVAAGLIGYGAPWWTALLCLPSLFFGNVARGPLLGLAIAAFYEVLVKTWRNALVGGAILGCFLAAFWLYRPATMIERMDTWVAMFWQITPLGSGLGSYFGNAPLFTVHAGDHAMRNLHANNDLLEIAYETGVPGLLLALAFLGSLIFASRSEGRPVKLVVLVFAMEGIVGFPFYLPATAGLFALAAGHLARHCDIRVRAAMPSRVAL